jgi:rhodanese-related sulfurtransferase
LIEIHGWLRHINLGDALSESPNLRLITSAELLEEHHRGTLLLDTRPAEQFASLHIRGSIQISLMGYFAAWAAILIDPKQKLVLIVEHEKSAREAHNRLTRVGIQHVIGYSPVQENEWRRLGIELGSISTQRCLNLVPMLATDSSLQLIDVRSRAEWLKGHLPRAISMPLLELPGKTAAIKGPNVNLVYCHEGYRATTAASILMREGADNIGILIDGVEGWSASGFPLETP